MKIFLSIPHSKEEINQLNKNTLRNEKQKTKVKFRPVFTGLNELPEIELLNK